MKTAIQRILERIIRDIGNPHSGLLPGVQLVERALTEKYKTNRTTIRTVFFILEDKGLITNIPNRGKFVRRLSERELRESYELRAVLEGFAARLAASGINKNTSLASGLEHLLAELEQAEKEKDDDAAIEEKDYKFHQYIQQMCGNSKLSEFLERSQLQFYLIRVFRTNTKDIPRQTVSHRDIFDAIRKWNPDKAELMARQHVMNNIAHKTGGML